MIIFGRKRLNPEIENALRVLELGKDPSNNKLDEILQLLREKGKTDDKGQLILRLTKVEHEAEKR